MSASRGLAVSGPCAVCGCADRRVLKRVELADGVFDLCANDATIAGRLGLSLEQLRAEVALGAGAAA